VNGIYLTFEQFVKHVMKQELDCMNEYHKLEVFRFAIKNSNAVIIDQYQGKPKGKALVD
jgi:hypothetical protein